MKFPLFSFKKKKPPFLLKTDVHAHWLPGIDDGPKTMSASIDMLKSFEQAGFNKLIATPHIFWEYHPNTRQTIIDRFLEVQFEVNQQNINIKLAVAAEYYLDDYFATLLKKESLLINEESLLTFSNKSLLVECSMLGPTPKLLEYIFNIQVSGYQPVLAHPERYLHMQTSDYQRLIEQGCEFQVNLLSLTNHYGSEVRKRALFLLNNFSIKYVGSDAHSVNHIHKIQQFLNSSQSNKVFKNKTFFNEQVFNESVKQPSLQNQ